MFTIKRNKAGQQQVLFAQSGTVAATFPNRQLCHDWLSENYPEYVEGTGQYIIRKATEAAQKLAETAKRMNAPMPIEAQLNASVGRAVWRAR